MHMQSKYLYFIYLHDDVFEQPNPISKSYYYSRIKKVQTNNILQGSICNCLVGRKLNLKRIKKICRSA